MIIIIGLAVIMLGGFCLMRWGGWKYDTLGEIMAVFGGILLFIALLLMVTGRMTVQSEARRFVAVQATVELARENGTPIESAAIQIKVAEANEWLASELYWRGTVFRPWVHPIVEELEPIR